MLPDGVQEGKAVLFPPSTNLGITGPGKIDEGPFYNPGMALNRDLSVLLTAAWASIRGRELDFADVLAGTGARSLRLAAEVDAPIHVHANDADTDALEALHRGAAATNVVERITPHHGSAHAFLAGGRFDIIDVDPYGSPAPFVDSAMRAARHDGLVCITATDTAALCGRYPKPCRRRYGAIHQLHPAPWHAEVGLRILAALGVQAAGRYDRGAVPVLSVARRHWMRVVLRVSDRRADAAGAHKNIGWASTDDHYVGHLHDFPGDLPAGQRFAGPLWTGQLHDATLIEAMQRASETHPTVDPEVDALLALLHQEADAPAFWVDPGVLQKHFGTSAPRRKVLMERLESLGYVARRSHIEPQAIRTNAPREALRRAWDLPESV